jgi:MFS family permease
VPEEPYVEPLDDPDPVVDPDPDPVVVPVVVPVTIPVVLPAATEQPVVTTINDEVVPLIGIVTTVRAEPVPLASIDLGSWALLNLILTVFGVILTLGLFGAYFIKRTRKDVDEEKALEQRGKKLLRWRLIGLIGAALAVILFLLTQDMTLPMVLTDKWTIAHAGILAVLAVVAVFAINRKEVKEDNAEAVANA